MWPVPRGCILLATREVPHAPAPCCSPPLLRRIIEIFRFLAYNFSIMLQTRCAFAKTEEEDEEAEVKEEGEGEAEAESARHVTG